MIGALGHMSKAGLKDFGYCVLKQLNRRVYNSPEDPQTCRDGNFQYRIINPMSFPRSIIMDMDISSALNVRDKGHYRLTMRLM